MTRDRHSAPSIPLSAVFTGCIPFKCDGALWVCTGITGPSLAASDSAENEAYRLVPEQMFTGVITSYREKTGTADGAEAARSDPKGFTTA